MVIADEAAWNFPFFLRVGSSLRQGKMEGHKELIGLMLKGLDPRSSLGSK